MRKLRDFDAELKALGDRARQLKERKVQQLGELVAATGADALPIEQLAGALLSATENNDLGVKEGWRKRGAAFFQRTGKAGQSDHTDTRRDPSSHSGASSPDRQGRT